MLVLLLPLHIQYYSSSIHTPVFTNFSVFSLHTIMLHYEFICFSLFIRNLHFLFDSSMSIYNPSGFTFNIWFPVYFHKCSQ